MNAGRAIRRKPADREHLLIEKRGVLLCCGTARIDLFWANPDINFPIALKRKVDPEVDLTQKTISPSSASESSVL
jgi:hypothetical protein